MAVPANTGDYLKNTTGGAFVKTNEGGTILGNTSTGTVITKALALKDNSTDFPRSPIPVNKANGLIGNHKPLTAGTFAYEEEGKYTIAASSTTISGVASTKVLITSAYPRDAIHRFMQSFGAKTVTAFRAGRFSWTSTKRTGAALAARINWMTVASGGMDTASAPASLNENMWDPSAGSVSANSDNAANPTRAVPGTFVMKVDFVDLDEATGGDFFVYKAITGM
tara:strand:- start:39 stop:710 length:672 start_codon:yes stop_codon:yes gene_type:complete